MRKTSRDSAAVRLAAVLARVPSLRDRTADEIAEIAIRAAAEATRARAAVKAGRPMAPAISSLETSLSGVPVDVIATGDQDGMAVGLRFRSPVHVSGHRNIFPLA